MLDALPKLNHKELLIVKIHTDKLSERTKKLLEEVLVEYGAKEIIRIEEDGTYDGYLDVDFMLENGWILSLHLDYNYDFNSSGQYPFEYSDEEIKWGIRTAIDYHLSMEEYEAWRNEVKVSKSNSSATAN
jgi:hypothetical protein